MAMLLHSWIHYYTIGTVFVVGDQIIHKQDTFECTTQHTAASDKEPGVGGSWATYWTRTTDALETPTPPRLQDLADVNPAGLADNDIPTYDSATGKFTMEGAAGVSAYVGGRVTRGANQAITTGVATAVSWDGSTFESDTTVWDIAQPTRVYARGAGKYSIKVSGRWAANSNGYRYAYVYKNGVANGPFMEFPAQPISARQSFFQMTDTLNLADGDYIEVYVFHNSTTSPLDLIGSTETTFCVLERIGT